MGFTVLELKPHLDPLFDKCITQGGISLLFKANTLNAAKAEINRQGALYTSEEQAYVRKIKSLHEEGKPLAFTLADHAQKLAQTWDDRMFEEMKPKVEFLGQMVAEAHKEMGEAVAHQGWRGNTPWSFDKAEKAVGTEGQAELFQLFKHHRDPMIAATGDLKTVIVKLQEFHARGMSSLKAAETLRARSKVNANEFLHEVEDLLAKARKADQDIEPRAKDEIDRLQKFVVLCNTRKTKLDPQEIKLAEGNQLKNEIWLKNNKTTTKTLEVERANAALRVAKSVPPGQVSATNTKLAEVKSSLEKARKKLDDLGVTLEAHKKKLTEAKTRR